MRSRSDTTTSSKSRQRPKSRGSTTSEQSATTAPVQENRLENGVIQHVAPQPGLYSGQIHSSEPPMYQHNPEEMLLQYGHQMGHPQQYSLDPTLGGTNDHDMRPPSQQGFHGHEVHPYPIMQSYPHAMPQYGMPQEHLHHVRARSGTYDGMENQSPAPDDSETAENGSKRKKGAATSLANDAELRRLLQQYQGKTLKEVAVEVQKNENGGGKSEKPKQVFAMLWLQENCRRSTNSVRRDQVFARYTQKCGNERVPTLNPASFGKLVRIIFPNVQTRRLGVRGESKYHYVDLSLLSDESERPQPPLSQFMVDGGNGQGDHFINCNQPSKPVHQAHGRSVSVPQQLLPQPPTDSAEFPSPSKLFAPRSTGENQTQFNEGLQSAKTIAVPAKMDCHYLNTPLIRIKTSTMSKPVLSALPSVRATLPGTLSTYLGLPSPSSHTNSLPPNSQTDSPIDLPDIHAYLSGTSYDPSIADSLTHLYRSYCIVVIDAFRYCREKPFFHHHSAFNGTMTVPVSKLLANERLAPWIQECDMRMYKKMIRYIAPLVTQVVPEQVWGVFERVSTKLVPHLIGAFEEKCPTHVVVAKVVPASRFCHLLKKLREANTAANHVAGLLSDERGRTQMWVDLLTCVDPERVVEESMPPPESWRAVEGVVRCDLKGLIAPMENQFVKSVEESSNSLFANFLARAANDEQHASTGSGVMGTASSMFLSEEEMQSALDGWIQWLEKLPRAFPKHHPQCLVNWHNGFWKSIMTQLGIGGAQSYQAWWYLEAFLGNMLGWLTQMEGLLMDQTMQKDMEEREAVKRRRDEFSDLSDRSMQIDGAGLGERIPSQAGSGVKRKRGEEDVGGEERNASRGSHGERSLGSKSGSTSDEDGEGERDSSSQTQTQIHAPLPSHHTHGLDGATDSDHDLEDELGNGAPLDLPSIDTTTRSSPRKRHHQAHDDSGISLDIEIEGEMMDVGNASGGDGEEQLKRLKKEWGIMSDPADADGHVVVI